jgi:dolichyl-phosphate-mannose--protein O-mannosyl transferase
MLNLIGNVIVGGLSALSGFLLVKRVSDENSIAIHNPNIEFFRHFNEIVNRGERRQEQLLGMTMDMMEQQRNENRILAISMMICFFMIVVVIVLAFIWIISKLFKWLNQFRLQTQEVHHHHHHYSHGNRQK